jgi:hypothetical protein
MRLDPHSSAFGQLTDCVAHAARYFWIGCVDQRESIPAHLAR